MSSRVTKSSRRNANCKRLVPLYTQSRPTGNGRAALSYHRESGDPCTAMFRAPHLSCCWPLPACPAIRQRLRPASTLPTDGLHGRLAAAGECPSKKKAADLSRKTIRRSFRISSCGRHCGNPTRYRFASVYPDHRWSLPPGRSPPGANRRGNTADRSRSC